MSDAVRQAILYQLGNVHTSLPGAIVSYDYTLQKASIQPLLNKSWADGTFTPMPILENVPVIFPRAGGASLTFPVDVGDTCLLVFIERSIDLWLTVGGQVTPDDNRKFNISDAIAIPGLFPFSETSDATNNSDVLLTFNGSSFRIKANGDIVIQTSSKVAIGSSSTEVLDILSQLLVLLQGLSVMGLAFNGPLNATFIANVLSLQTQLDAIKGTIP
jgi:hypothetical protein